MLSPNEDNLIRMNSTSIYCVRLIFLCIQTLLQNTEMNVLYMKYSKYLANLVDFKKNEIVY